MAAVIYDPTRCRPNPRKGNISFGDANWNVLLKPGQNLLEPIDCDRLINHPDFETYHSWGAIAVEAPKVAVPDTIPLSLKDLSVEDANRFVDECQSSDRLNLWLSDTSNAKLKNKINLRLQAIAIPSN